MHAPRAWRLLLQDLAWLAAYGVAMVLGRLTVVPAVGISLFGPAAGIAVIWMLQAVGRRHLLRVATLLLVAAYFGPVALWHASPLGGLLLALAHVGHAVAVRLLIARAQGVRWYAAATPDTTTVRGLWLLCQAAVVGTLLSAPLAAAGAWVGAGHFVHLVGLAWVVRNTTADLLIAGGWFQLARSWAARKSERGCAALTPEPRRGAALELAALGLTSAAVTVVLFGFNAPAPFAFLMVATVTWTGARFTPLVVSVSSLVLGTAAIVLTLEGHGVFTQVADPLGRAITLQLFLGVTALAGGFLAASTCERQRLTEGIAAVNERFHRVLGALEDHIWSVELRPGGRSVVLYSSGGNAPFTGSTPTTGEHWAAMFTRTHPDDLGRLGAFGRQLIAEEPAEAELRIRDQDGRTRWWWIRAVPRTEDGRHYVDGITTDISQRMALDDLRNQFLAIAGHELRTPLTVIRGYAETLAEEVSDPRAARHAAAIERRAYQLELLIGDFFDLAKFQNGQIQLACAPVRLDQVVADAVRDHGPAAAEHGVRVELRTAPATVVGDLVRIRQVVDNLVDNAIKYNRRLGTVVVSCGTSEEEGVLEVQDTGIGVPEQELPQLFERFFRASNGQAHTITGTGLGLAVVKAIVEAHHGSIEATANEAGGLTVRMRVPSQRQVEKPDLSDAVTLG